MLLHDKKSDRSIFVGNTHLLFNPRRGDVKLSQLGLLFANMQKVRNDLRIVR